MDIIGPIRTTWRHFENILNWMFNHQQKEFQNNQTIEKWVINFEIKISKKLQS